MRTNERAAAALGVSVFGAKLYAFGLGAALAALGGILIAFETPTVTFTPTFDVFGSISAVVYAVIGGVGAALGAAVGAAFAPGTVGAKLFSLLGDDVDDLFRLFGGLLLLVVLLQAPDGLVMLYRKLVLRLASRLRPQWQLVRRPSPALSDGSACPPDARDLDATRAHCPVRRRDRRSTTSRSPSHLARWSGSSAPTGPARPRSIDAVTGYVDTRAPAASCSTAVQSTAGRRAGAQSPGSAARSSRSSCSRA